MGRESKAGTQQVAKLALASHTKLKFRQPGQATTSDVARRDLRAELAAAERTAQDKKRKADGLPPLPAGTAAIENGSVEDEAAAKRRKVLEEAAELDRDDSDSDSDEEENGGDKGKDKAEEDSDRCVFPTPGLVSGTTDPSDSDSDSDDDDTAALMAELARIKAERAEEKARLVRTLFPSPAG